MYEDNNSSYENKSKLPSLQIRRFKKTIGVETFKIIQQLVQVSSWSTISFKIIILDHMKQQFYTRVRTTVYGLTFFRYSAAQICNELHNNCRRETS